MSRIILFLVVLLEISGFLHVSPHVAAADDMPGPLRQLFDEVDKLGRGEIGQAKFVEVKFSHAEQPDRVWQEKAWVVSEDEESLILMKNDLVPWKYAQKGPTTAPSSWSPTPLHVETVTDDDFEALCRDLAKRRQEPEKSVSAPKLYGPGPSYRLLIAHAAWKKGLTTYCLPVVANDPAYAAPFEEYAAAVKEDLAWLHFLRGVNLLMFADRNEVIRHLRLAAAVSPQGRLAGQSERLAKDLETLIAADVTSQVKVDGSKLSATEKAKRYISQLKDVHCPQMSQPGSIMHYAALVDGRPDPSPPTLKLKQLEMAAVPALIQALDDDTPTRTVYHWRDFDRNRIVWRVSDFSWNILRDITQKEFGYRPAVGFTLSSMRPDEKQFVINSIKKWHAENRDLSPDDRMIGFFSSQNPDDWMTAGKYFLAKNDNRALEPLIEKIPLARGFVQGDLCELVAEFGDPRAKAVLQQVMAKASEHADRLSAAMGLWTLGDPSGVALAIEYVRAKDQPYGSWDDPIWFLMRTRTQEAMAALESVIKDAPAERSGEIVSFILASITGDLWGERRESAGCVEICPVLISAMRRTEYTGGSVNGIKTRIKDAAAKALVLLREGTDDPFAGRFVQVDPQLFDELDPDEGKRDAQITAIIEWYEQNREKISWDAAKNRLVVNE